MATLLSRIREDSVAARKAAMLAGDETLKAAAGNKASFLITLFAEAARTGKDDGNRESTDAEVQATIKKFIKNADETLKALGEKAPESQARLNIELGILRAYLPQQAGAQELQAAITDIVVGLTEKSPKQMGVVMNQLQARFAGNFDKKAASELVRVALQNDAT